MNKNSVYILFILLISGVFIGIMTYFSKERIEKEKYRDFKRIYAHDSLIVLYSLKVKGDIETIRSNKEKVLLFDVVSQSVYCYKKVGDSIVFLAQLGNKGKGPNEYTHITGISFCENGNIKIADRNSVSITEVEYDGYQFFEKKYKRIPIIPESYLYAGENKSFIFSSDRNSGYESCFYIYNEDLDTVICLGNLIDPKNEFQNDILSFGGYFVDSDKFIGFVCRLWGCIAIFDKDAKFINLIKTVDQTPPPRVFVTDNGGSIMLDLARTKLVNASASIDNNKIYVLSKIKSKNISVDKQMDVIDVYELPSGRYEESILLPPYKNSRASTFFKEGNKMFVFYGEEIVCLKCYKNE